MRIAFFTPLNPVRSGISDYSEELLPYLARHADVDVVIGPYTPANQELVEQFQVLTAPEFMERRSVYDAIFYQIGNNYPSHSYMLPCLSAAPGIVVIHDYSLTYLILPATLERGDYRSLQRMLKPSCGADSDRMFRQILLGLADPYEVSLARPIVEMSRAVIVHNHHSYQRLSREFPEKRVARIPHATPIWDLPTDVPALRAKYGLGPDDLVLASVSSLAYNKRVQLVLKALRDLVPDFPKLRFVMVGQGELGSAAAGQIRDSGLETHVSQTGWVSSETYLDYIALSDIVLDLRFPTAGETSGSSLRAMQAAKPLVVSREGFFLELPDGCCVRVPVDENEQVTLTRVLRDLLADPARRANMGAAGREFVLSHLRLEQAAQSYIDLARETMELPKHPLPVWDFPAQPLRSVPSRLVSVAYKAGRFGYYYRRYGVAGTLKKALGANKS
jgi:glycosyltransferase involved in cell wall biosynthesis